MEFSIGQRVVTVRPLTVGDMREMGPALEALDAFCTAKGAARLALLPGLARAMAPCLCRLTTLTAAELDALTLPEFLALLGAVGAALRSPFPATAR